MHVITDIFLRSRSLLTLALVPLALAACEDDATGPSDPLVEGQVTLDASSPSAFTFLDLETSTEISVADPATSTEWDLGFRRFAVKLNGGVGGPGTVEGANLGNSEGSTGAEVTAFTQAYADSLYESVTEADIDGVAFVADGLTPDPGATWFRFDPQAGTLVANPGAAWKVRAADDAGFGLFRVTALDMAGQTPQGATVQVRYQASGAALSAPTEVVIDFSQGPGYIDIESGSVVAPGGCEWDFALLPSFMIDFNADCNAGSFPLDPTEDFTTVTAADDAPEYAGFLSTISGAFPSTVDDASGLFWYNIEGNQRLWPTFNVFLVRVGGDVYKVQVTDYYSSTGASGFPTVRFAQLR